MPKRYLLINPPRYEVLPEYIDRTVYCYQEWAGFYQPVALLRIGTYLRDLNNEVSMINCGNNTPDEYATHFLIGKRRCGNFKDKEIFSPLYHFGISFEDFKARLMLQKKPDEIYITSFFTYQWEPIHEIVHICKEVFPSARVTLGGVYSTLCPDHARSSGADNVYTGELKASNHCRLALDLLDGVPDYVVIKTSRGCPGHCSYCAVPLLEGHAMRYRSPEDVVDEIQEKIRDYNIKKVVFWESNILVNAKKYLERILELIIKRRFNIELRFPEGLDPRLLTDTLLYKMRAAGVKRVSLSVETSSEVTAIRRFKSPYKLKAFKKIMATIKKIDLMCGAFVMVGLPGQKVEEAKKTVLDVLHAGCFPSIMPFTPIPGTQEYSDCFAAISGKGLEDLHPLLWPCVESSSDYERLCKLYVDCFKLFNIKKKER